MLFLKEANLNDYEKEYEAMKQFPADENGFTDENGFINEYYGVSKKEFVEKILPTLINQSKGIDLPDGYVPCTYYFLWDEEEIVGLFKVRHWLNGASVIYSDENEYYTRIKI